MRDRCDSDRNSTFIPGPSGSTRTSKPGAGVAQTTSTPPGPNEIAVDPPTSWNVMVWPAGAGGWVVVEVVLVVELLVVLVDELDGGVGDGPGGCAGVGPGEGGATGGGSVVRFSGPGLPPAALAGSGASVVEELVVGGTRVDDGDGRVVVVESGGAA